MRSHALSSVLLVVALAVFLGGCSLTVVHVRAIPLAPENLAVQPDASNGFAEYEAALAKDGDWQTDATYGAHWCPSQAAIGATSFRPYFDGGHWTISDRAFGASPAGSVAWKSDAAEGSWSDITSHHGYWIEVTPEDEAQRWCWVPGAEESPARVVWREGDGFVGWAPATPDEVAYDDLDYDALEWTFTFLGTLLDGSPCDGALVGDAREIALTATAPASARTRGYVPSKVAPKVAVLKNAQQRFASYTLNPNIVAAVTAQKNKSGSDDAKSASSSSGGKKSSDDAKASASDSAKAQAQARLNAMAYYDSMLEDPMFGPMGVVPRFPANVAASSPIATNDGGSGVGRSSSALGGSASDRHSQPSSQRAKTNGASVSTSHLGSHVSSSHVSSSRSSSSSHSGSRSSSSSHSSGGHHR